MTKTTSRRAQYLRGMRAGLPVVFGFVPVGIAYAVMARQAGFTAAETVLMSLSVFAGASQMMAVGMVAQGAGLAAIILATFLLNLRHVIMSACVNHRLPRSGLAARLLAAFGVTDESFAIFTATPAENCTLPFFFGMITVTYSSWVGGSAIGAAASGLLPPVLSASLGVALYAMFIGLLLPSLRSNTRLALLAAATAACNALLGCVIDSSWALILSTLAGATAGVFWVHFPGEGENA